jgi:membrane protease YdiL (CAAX protease family)
MSSGAQTNAAARPGSKFGAFVQFVAAVLWFYVARSIAHRGALGMASQSLGVSNGLWTPLLEAALLAILMVVGYSGMGLILNQQLHPVHEQGLPRRSGRGGEFGLGLAVGWALAVVCVLPLVLVGGIAIVLSLQLTAWGWLIADAAFFVLVALAEEVAFRGYGFQCFERAVGPFGATCGFAAIYAMVQSSLPGSNRASVAVSVALSLLLSTCYLRTRALWLSWGLNFAWKASRALLFGLAVAGVNSHSPIVQGEPMGPFWLSGGGFGLDGSWFAFFVLLAALPVLYRLTRNLDYVYNAPVFIPAGMPVDLDAAARSQHEAATKSGESQPPVLVQIVPPPPMQPLPLRQAAPSEPDPQSE